MNTVSCKRGARLHPQLESGKDGVRLEGKNGGHFSCHAESALIALLCPISNTKSTLAVRIDKVSYPAATGEFVGLR